MSKSGCRQLRLPAPEGRISFRLEKKIAFACFRQWQPNYVIPHGIAAISMISSGRSSLAPPVGGTAHLANASIPKGRHTPQLVHQPTIRPAGIQHEQHLRISLVYPQRRQSRPPGRHPRRKNPSSLETLTSQARRWRNTAGRARSSAPAGAGPTRFTVAAALAVRTTTFEPLIAIRPGYWRPAELRLCRRHPRPPDRRPRARQHRLGPGQPRPPMATAKAIRPTVTPAPRIHAPGPPDCGPRRTSPMSASTSGSPGRLSSHASRSTAAAGTRSFISAAPPRRPSAWPRPRPMSSSSGAIRSTASASGSNGSRC